MVTTALTALAAVVVAAVVVVLVRAIVAAMLRPLRADPVDDAYDTLPAGRRELVVDTRTGSHDRLPIRDDIRHVLIAYCESMWRTQPTTHDRENPL